MAATRPLPAPAQAWNCHQDDWPLAPSAGNPWLGLLLVQQVCQCQRRPSTPASWRQSTQHLAIYPALERHTASRAASLASRPPSPSTVYGMLPCLLTRSPALPATMPHGGGRCGAGQKSAAAPLAVGPSSLWTGPRAFAAACLRTRPCACASHCGPQWNEQQASRGGGPCEMRYGPWTQQLHKAKVAPRSELGGLLWAPGARRRVGAATRERHAHTVP